MTTPVPSHVARTRTAETEGFEAGQGYEQLIHETCPPEKWTRTARREWCVLLERISTNPYHGVPYLDATDDQLRLYAKQWDLGFTNGRTDRRNHLARKATVTR